MKTPSRYLRVVSVSLIIVLGFVCGAVGQTETATVSGLITDRTGSTVPGAEIRLQSVERGTVTTTTTNNAGIYVFPSVHPGQYQISVEKQGFKQVDLLGLIVNIQDHIEQNFRLEVGSVAESVTVEAAASMINTTDAAVGTVVDRKYVENMPLNGRSFQDLILLTPGVVTNTPQVAAAAGTSGEFSVNGQRTESNYYTVDGVGANVGISPETAARPGVSGSLSAPTALGTTQGLVSVDALEEFRIQSSTYSAEYGRSPGGQFSFLTRSGTNQWHGTAFDYLRNNYFDANDWFNNFFGQPQPPLRQNDFGGTLGGPVVVPRIYSGKDKTFFFFSYEGLRLLQPQAATISYVPDTSIRANTPQPLQQVLNAFPVQNGAEVLDQMGNPTGLAEFIGTWSNPSSIDSTSVRLDHVISDKLRLFFRFSDTSSAVSARGSGFSGVPSVSNSTSFTTRTYTGGATSSFSNSLSNELRLNYSSNEGTFSFTPGNFDGARAVNLVQLSGFAVATKPSPTVQITLFLGNFSPILSQSDFSGRQNQWNLIDTIGLTLGRHQLKFGFDFRRLEPNVYETSPAAIYDFASMSSVESNSVDFGFGLSHAPAFPVYTNVSSFAQDEWRATSRLSLSMGLRWEVNPAPGAAKGNLPYTVQGNSLSTLSLAPQGTPLWNTTWFNFAPRLGAAYVLRNGPGHETVIRGGGGVFFDTAQQLGSYGYDGPGFAAATPFFGSIFGSPASFPLPPAQVSPPIVNPPVAPYSTNVAAFPAHLQLPYTLQWNASVEQALGKSTALTVSYVGANGRRLLEQTQVNPGSLNPNFTTILFTKNGRPSDYNSLQLQVQRRLAHGLQALGSYTFAHAIDYASQNVSLPYTRGNSDYDVRHNFSSAFSYDLPNRFKGRLAKTILGDWGLDDRFTARTGFPVRLDGPPFTDPATGNTLNSGLNLVPGQAVYIYGSQCAVVYGSSCPGGRAINPNAFMPPPGCTPFACSGQIGTGDAPRNFARGFGAWQMDLAVRREFPIYERLKLQFRAEAFNIFNHPNFGAIQSTYCSAGPGTGCMFGQATGTLANSLGGLSPLYQTGGPRSMQFALKLIF